MIYLDNASTTKVSDKVVEVMVPYYSEVYANCSSLHEFGQKAKEKLEDCRQRVARVFNAKSREIYFTSGGTESDNQAILSAAQIGIRQEKKHIITTKFEHHAVLNVLNKLKQQGFTITYLDVNSNGIIKIEDLEKAITPQTVLVSIMFANNEIGTIQPIKEIGRVCKEHKVLFHTDAVQAVGNEKIDVDELGIDMLSLSAHKFHGPKGVGVLYARSNVPLTQFIVGGSQENNRRAGTENLPGIVGMVAALEAAYKDLDTKNQRLKKMRDKLFDELSKIPHSAINGDRENRLCSNFSMCFEGIEGESLLLLLSDKGICASSGSACTSGSLAPSHVLLSIGRPHEVAHGSLRLTLSRYTTEDEINKVIEAVPQVVAYLRSISPVWDELEKGVRKHVI